MPGWLCIGQLSLQPAHTFYCDPMLLKDFYMLSLVNCKCSSHKHRMQFTVTAIHLAACIPQQELLNSNKMLMKQKCWLIHCAPTRKIILAIFFKQIICGNWSMNSRPPRHCLTNTNCMPSYDASSLLENQWCQRRRQVAGRMCSFNKKLDPSLSYIETLKKIGNLSTSSASHAVP